MNCFITNQGNFLVQAETGKFMFVTPCGELLREVEQAEGIYLQSVCLPAMVDIPSDWWKFNPEEDILVSEITDEEIRQLLKNAEWEESGGNNYQLTDYRCHYNSESHTLNVQEVCVNEYGSCYGRGFYTTVQLPINRKVSWNPAWTDISA